MLSNANCLQIPEEVKRSREKKEKRKKKKMKKQ